MVVWTLAWGNPYTKPPDGQPEVLGMQITASTSDAYGSALVMETGKWLLDPLQPVRWRDERRTEIAGGDQAEDSPPQPRTKR